MSCSLRQLFPSGGSIRGCIKGIKALGKYVDLKRLNTTGISFGCTADLLVERTMTFHGHGFLPLALLDVAPIPAEVYSGFGFRGTQDNNLLYYRSSPVSWWEPASAAANSLGLWEQEGLSLDSWPSQ